MPRRQHHHHRGRHDVYDDTTHNQESFDPSNEVTVHRRESDRSSRHPRRNDNQPDSNALVQQDPNALVLDPFQDMNSMWRSAERDMDSFFDRGFGGFGGGLFGNMRNMMTSMDRMFDQVTSNAGPGSGGSYFYESRKMTVGPDGRVHEETVRTVPDAEGRPQTSRTIRDGDRVEETGPYPGRIQHTPSSRRYNNDVVIEEVDEQGHPIHEGRVTRAGSRDDRDRTRTTRRRTSRDDRDRARANRRNSRDDRDRHQGSRHQTSGNWLRNKYREWRSGV